MAQLAQMDHPRVVNAARFSPVTGHKVRLAAMCLSRNFRAGGLLSNASELWLLPASR